jgi:hypothetical protein
MSSSRPAEVPASKRSGVDVAASAVFLVLAILVAAVGWAALFVEISFRTASSGPTPPPLCVIDAAPLVGFPLVAIAVIVTGLVMTLVRFRRHRHSRFVGLATLGIVFMLIPIAAVIPFADTMSICGL